MRSSHKAFSNWNPILLNNTPILWYSKCQKTVETSTYGSEIVSDRIAVEQIISLRYTLRMLGVHVEKKSMMLGDNMSVIVNTTVPSSVIRKKHQSCNYHKVREAIAGGFIIFGHINSEENLADILTKPLNVTNFHGLLEHYLFR